MLYASFAGNASFVGIPLFVRLRFESNLEIIEEASTAHFASTREDMKMYTQCNK